MILENCATIVHLKQCLKKVYEIFFRKRECKYDKHLLFCVVNDLLFLIKNNVIIMLVDLVGL